MNRRTLTELDYFRIRDEIAGNCVSEEGKSLLEKYEPLTDVKRIDEAKALGKEWLSFLLSSKNSALTSWPPIHQILPVLKTEGSTLLQEQIFALLLFINAKENAEFAIENAKEDLKLEKLYELAQTLPDFTEAKNEISRILDDSGQLKDLPQLREIRGKIAACKREITVLMKKYTADSSLADALESNVPAFRADRQVLAVKSSRRAAVKGIIHEMSASGQTVYIEPEDVVRKNNELIQEEFHLQQEIRMIFHELTAKLRPMQWLFAKALPVMIKLDTTCAGAKWGKQNRCNYVFNCKIIEETLQEEPLLLLQARHPLLGEKAVPVDIRFMPGKRILIITGPNTGGKTVTLKTIALFAMLNQTGFPVPAVEGSRLPVFSNVFADIGDSQSLDQSLSTFSGHMKNIASAVNGADKNSLVLLDELGSGTDPLEGGAIAMAVLDTLIERKAFVLCTTHHGILKNYGYTHESCINASVEFDNTTLSPTYHLSMGIPGESRALDIARRSGLSGKICNAAKGYIANEQADVSSLIKGLSAKHAELSRIQKEMALREKELADLRRKTDLHELKLRQKEMDLQKAGHRDSQKFLLESRKMLENLVRELKEGEVTREKTLKVKAFIKEIQDSVEQAGQKVEQDEENLVKDMAVKEVLIKQIEENKKQKKTAKKRLKNSEALALAQSLASPVETASKPVQKLEFKSGAQVLVGSSKRQGTLIRLEKKGMWSVQIGSIKMNVNQKNMILIAQDGNSKLSQPEITLDLADSQKINVDDSKFPGSRPMFELRLLGMRVDEALKMLERQLDLCTLHNFPKFSIIHGKGTGVLQQAVQDYLSHYPGIANFSFAPPEDGGTGKTYVELAV